MPILLLLKLLFYSVIKQAVCVGDTSEETCDRWHEKHGKSNWFAHIATFWRYDRLSDRYYTVTHRRGAFFFD